MKNMKVFLVITAIMISTICIGMEKENAMLMNKGRSGKREMVQKMNEEEILSELSLSENQKEELRELFEQFKANMDEIMKSGKRPERLEMEKMMTERDEKAREILNEEQYKIYEECIKSTFKPSRRDM